MLWLPGVLVFYPIYFFPRSYPRLSCSWLQAVLFLLDPGASTASVVNERETGTLQAFPRAASSSTFAWKIPHSQHPAGQSVPPGSPPCIPPPLAQPPVLPQAVVWLSDRMDHTSGPPSTLCNTIPTLVSRQQFVLVSFQPVPQDSDCLPPFSNLKQSSIVLGTQQECRGC